MKRLRKHGARLVAVGAVALIAAAAIAASASGTTVTAGNLVINVDGSFSPTALPKTTKAPITLKANGSIATNDGTHVPPLKTLALEFDKHGSINVKGLPTCSVGQITNTLTNQALQKCGDALVGRGTAEAEVQFPDAAPVPAHGTLLVFNAPTQGGKPVLIQHTYVTAPVSTTFVTKAVISKASGKYGTSTTIDIPPISGGYGSFTGFSVKLAKTWNYKGKKQALLNAECATGHFFAHGDFKFVNGTDISGNVVKSCTPKG